MNHATWTPASLSDLLTSNGMARYLARRGPLFVPADPLPQAGRPGEPLHPDTPCLLWTYGGNGNGYGRIHTPERGSQYVHVVTFELVNGPVPDGMDLAHQCERRPCGRPSHVRPKPRQENGREGAKRRYPDRLLGRAPAAACSRCGKPMTASIDLGGSRSGNPRWSWTCWPCSRFASPGVPRQRSGVKSPMSDADVAALRAFLG